jgi:hypothetical protein
MQLFQMPRVIGPSAGWISACKLSGIRTGSAAWRGLKSTLGVESWQTDRKLPNGSTAPMTDHPSNQAAPAQTPLPTVIPGHS